MGMSFSQLLDDVAMIYALLELDETGDAQEIARSLTTPAQRERAREELKRNWEKKPVDEGPLGNGKSAGEE